MTSFMLVADILWILAPFFNGVKTWQEWTKMWEASGSRHSTGLRYALLFQ